MVEILVRHVRPRAMIVSMEPKQARKYLHLWFSYQLRSGAARSWLSHVTSDIRRLPDITIALYSMASFASPERLPALFVVTIELDADSRQAWKKRPDS